MSRFSEAFDRYVAAKAAYEKARDDLFRLAPEPDSTTSKFRTLDELNAALDEQRREQAKKAAATKVDPKQRMKEIEDELDIIRGVVPTPAGYTVDRRNVRRLVRELQELKAAA